MKSIILVASCVLALWAAPSCQAAESPPAGAVEKIEAALPDKPFAAPKKPRKLLIFSKTNGFRHESIATGKVAFTELGKKTGAFETVISDDLANFEEDQLQTFDGICFLSTTMEVFSPTAGELKGMSDTERAEATAREARLKKNLMEYVKAGHGFIGIHAATDTFYQWPEYNRMINGCFDGHPWGAGDTVSIKVEPGQESHPLVEMFGGENVEFKEEIYQFKEPYDSKAVHMLLRLDTEKTDMNHGGIKRTDGDFGVAWARGWGSGRVFYCSLGHNHDMFWHPKVLRHYLAGIQWALGDYQVEIKHPSAPDSAE